MSLSPVFSSSASTRSPKPFGQLNPIETSEVLRGIRQLKAGEDLSRIRQRFQKPALDLLNNHSGKILKHISTITNPLLVVGRYDLTIRNKIEAAHSRNNFNNVTCPQFFVTFDQEKKTFTPEFSPSDGEYMVVELKPENGDALIEKIPEIKPRYVLDGRITHTGALTLRDSGPEEPIALVLQKEKEVKGKLMINHVSAGGGVSVQDAAEDQSDPHTAKIKTLANAALREFAEEILGLDQNDAKNLSAASIVDFIKDKTGAESLSVTVRADENLKYLDEDEFDCLTRASYNTVIKLEGGKSNDELLSYIQDVNGDKTGKPTVTTTDQFRFLAMNTKLPKPIATTAKLINEYTKKDPGLGSTLRDYQGH
jgi:hypothetical protein